MVFKKIAKMIYVEKILIAILTVKIYTLVQLLLLCKSYTLTFTIFSFLSFCQLSLFPRYKQTILFLRSRGIKSCKNYCVS